MAGEQPEDDDARWAGDEGTPLGHQGTKAGQGLPVASGATRAYGVNEPADASELTAAP